MAVIGWFSMKIPLYLQPGWNLGFKDLQILTLDGAVAQSVEQRTENPCVGGSIPPHTTDPAKAGFFIVHRCPAHPFRRIKQ